MKHITKLVAACLLAVLLGGAVPTPLLAASPQISSPQTPAYVDELVPVSEIAVHRKTATIRQGGSIQLRAKIRPANASNTDVTWKSTRPGIATVDEDGLVEGVKNGTVRILLYSNNNLRAECEIIVGTPVSRVVMQQTRVSLRSGHSTQLKTSVLPKNASNRKLVWSSENTDVATVKQNGTVTGLRPGKVVIFASAQDGTKKGSCTVVVTSSVKSVALEYAKTTLNPRASVKLIATVLPRSSINKKVTWKSSNPSVATVGKDGTVFAIKPGQTTITVTTNEGRKTARCVLTVTNRIFNGRNKVTSPFQPPSRPNHNAIDIVGIDNGKIHSTTGGRVRWARQVAPGAAGWGSTWEWGFFVWIESPDATHHIYAHMIGPPAVSEGQIIKPGEVLGVMGNTGYSFGTHTHYEVRALDRRTPIDPSTYAGVPNQVGIYG